MINNHEQQVAQFYDNQTTQYDSGYDIPVCVAEDRIVADILQPIVKGKVLDVGCGTGLFLSMAQPESYVGLEISYKMAEQARLKHPESQFVQASQEGLPFKDHSFDSLVSMYGPFSYSLTPEQVLAEFKRVLVPGGSFAVMPYTLRVGHGLAMGGFSTATHPDIEKNFYTTDKLRELFADFQNVQVRGINYTVNSLIEFAEQMHLPPFNVDALTAMLAAENNLADMLPVEFARHSMVTGTT